MVYCILSRDPTSIERNVSYCVSILVICRKELSLQENALYAYVFTQVLHVYQLICLNNLFQVNLQDIFYLCFRQEFEEWKYSCHKLQNVFPVLSKL